MSTRSAIIEKTATGYRGIYCHYDGYLEGVGQTLLEHYGDPAKVSRLLDLRDISVLGERVEPTGPHSYARKEEGATVAYRRDRGEPIPDAVTGATIESVASQIGHNGYVYVFENGGWTIGGKPIKEAIEAEATTNA